MAPSARASKRKASESPVSSPKIVRAGRKPRESVASVVAPARQRVSAVPKPELNKLVVGLNDRPILDTYVFGTGSMCELGLGPDAKNKIVKRPRLNPYLAKLDVVDVAVGGMHAAALTKDGLIYTWGVNDQGALGRDTTWDGGVVDADAGDDSDSEAEVLNPKESTPTAVEHAQSFVKVAASDSLTVAIDADGHIWAWGTFRCSDGILGFNSASKVANRPQRLVLKEKFVDLACGTDHVLALSASGKVFAWGNGQQFQLGRRVVERTRLNGLVPREFGLKRIVSIGCGSYHSFAKDTEGRIFAWGLNQFGQCGVTIEELGEDGAVVAVPALVEALSGLDVALITGGEHHSIALTTDGTVYVWGRLDACQLGLDRASLPESAVADASGKPRYIPAPTRLTLEDDLKASTVAAGTHHNVLIDREGRAWSWGFGESYQVGQGPPGEDVEQPTRIENTATQGKKMVLAGAGGQFSLICALRQQSEGGAAGDEHVNGSVVEDKK
ncbi:putative Ran exchange factor Prp20/Pim1 [Taphrina deformans PYCC 5710]|uniref:Ran exchange factor Prp20/Pim1 n=1 Tax=Taphrina deformans (strain PYCC 5710 / ATCC 11124 / CBS 356.35 / IMI 108563 / JCM 9778 / NBRC 8474) TaxID=1097556 RepID=R4X7Z3_TAPDE|nr:putative Ran exchange factor Prp20/Pim1 [Taphrina deformans PYCC 5710]|eukprot:CCG81367.1 putative Ran exchange factor Prp20/Pim1 [Taphrina deformans PYCC 5710]